MRGKKSADREVRATGDRVVVVVHAVVPPPSEWHGARMESEISRGKLREAKGRFREMGGDRD